MLALIHSPTRCSSVPPISPTKTMASVSGSAAKRGMMIRQLPRYITRQPWLRAW
jgi:hypothetical protein